MKKLSFILVIVAFILSGCSNTGAFLSANQTIVNLNEGNYSIAAANVSGESESGYLLGVSYSTGLNAATLAIARVEGTGLLYAEALENLWNNYEAEHGDISDRKLALANVRYDSEMLNLILYTKVKVIVRADIVEFEQLQSIFVKKIVAIGSRSLRMERYLCKILESGSSFALQVRYLKFGLETGFWVESVLPPDGADEVAARNFYKDDATGAQDVK